MPPLPDFLLELLGNTAKGLVLFGATRSVGGWLEARLAAEVRKRVAFYFEADDMRCEVVSSEHHLYRVGVLNRTGKPVRPVFVRVVKTWPQDSGSWGRPLQEKDDAPDGNLEFPMSKAGVEVNPTPDTPSRFFNVVEKFYRDIPDPRFAGPHRFLDHVYVSAASGIDRHSAIVIPDQNIKGIRLRLDTPVGCVEQDFSVKVVNGRLFFGRPGGTG